MNDLAVQRNEAVARWLRQKSYGRSTHPASVLLEAADMLTAPLDELPPTVERCTLCNAPLPPRTGRRGRPRELCELHRRMRGENRAKNLNPAE